MFSYNNDSYLPIAINYNGRGGVIAGQGGSGGGFPGERINSMEMAGGPLSQVGNQVAQSYGAQGIERRGTY